MNIIVHCLLEVSHKLISETRRLGEERKNICMCTYNVHCTSHVKCWNIVNKNKQYSEHKQGFYQFKGLSSTYIAETVYILCDLFFFFYSMTTVFFTTIHMRIYSIKRFVIIPFLFYCIFRWILVLFCFVCLYQTHLLLVSNMNKYDSKTFLSWQNRWLDF